MSIDIELSALQSLLYGYNYAVSLYWYDMPFIPDTMIEEYIVQVLSAAKVGGTQPISAQNVLREIEYALRYSGDASSGPKPSVLNSPQFEEQLRAVLSHVEQAVFDATSITSFWLQAGHPAYPVFWDFAFVIQGSHEVKIFIGSSSD